jgi:hypothetical protein
MPTTKLTAEDILEESEAIKVAVSLAFPSQQKEEERLKLTGLEILAFVGVKIALPIFCGLVSRVLYDAYKDFQTRSKAENALRELLEKQGLDSEVVSDNEILKDAMTRLVDEGVDEEKAKEIAAQALIRIKRKLSSALKNDTPKP